MKKILYCVTACILLLAAVGCGGGTRASGERPSGPQAAERSSQPEESALQPEAGGEAKPSETDGRVYRISLSMSKSWVIDRDGNEVADGAPVFYELVDLATGKPRYRYAERWEDTGERDEWGNAKVRTLRALCDMEGNQLLDWEEMEYGPGFGDYIVRREQRIREKEQPDPDRYHAALYHVPSGTEHYEGTDEVRALGDYFLLCDGLRTPLGVVDAAGEPYSGFPAPATYYSVYSSSGGCFTAKLAKPNEQTKEDLSYLLDRDFNVLGTYEWISGGYGYLHGDVLVCRNGDDWSVLNQRGESVFSIRGEDVEYYDGDLAVVKTGSFRSLEDPIKARLITVGGEEIAAGFSWLQPAQNHYDEEPARHFLGIEGETVVLLDRAGNRLASRDIPHVRSVNALTNSLYVYYVEDGSRAGEGMLDENLEELFSAQEYRGIELIADSETDYRTWGDGSHRFLLRASKELGSDEPGHTLYRMDLLDESGKLIIGNISNLYDVGPDRIAIRRGFDVGLIDWDGNWIVRRSVFQGLGDD